MLEYKCTFCLIKYTGHDHHIKSKMICLCLLQLQSYIRYHDTALLLSKGRASKTNVVDRHSRNSKMMSESNISGRTFCRCRTRSIQVLKPWDKDQPSRHAALKLQLSSKRGLALPQYATPGVRPLNPPPSLSFHLSFSHAMCDIAPAQVPVIRE